MSDQSVIPFEEHILLWRRWAGGQRELTAEVRELWYSNMAFRRVVEMDKIVRVKKGESYHCTRLIDDNGDTVYDEPLGPLKGDAGEGYYVKLTTHHTSAYMSLKGVRSGLEKAGCYPRSKQLKALKRDGVVYMTNGLDNRIHWVMKVDRKMAVRLNQCRYTVLNMLTGSHRRVKVGDYLCVRDNNVKLFYGDERRERRSTEIEVEKVYAGDYGQDRFRSLHDLQ